MYAYAVRYDFLNIILTYAEISIVDQAYILFIIPYIVSVRVD